MDLSWMAWTWQTAVFFAFIALALVGAQLWGAGVLSLIVAVIVFRKV